MPREAVLRWYRREMRDLPWRREGVTPWQVLMSEVMLAQTPVLRVTPVWDAFVATWPDPSSMAVGDRADVVRAWGRLGYPRRARWLHEAAALCVRDHAGEVPDDYAALRALPGVGDYTANAVLAFAYGRAVPVLDTNVRRVFSRWLDGLARPAPAVTAAERARATEILPGREAPTWSVAVMELGALVCTARSPLCSPCPLIDSCAWRAAGYPDGPTPAPAQRFTGSDRQVRGLLLGAVRISFDPVPRAALDLLWSDPPQRDRALASLLADQLVTELPDGTYVLG